MVANRLGWPALRGRAPIHVESPRGNGQAAHARRPARVNVRAGALIALLYLSAGLVAYWHVLVHLATVQPGFGSGDVARYDWFVGWVPWALGHGVNPFISHVGNVPFGLNLMDDTSVLALGLVMAPVTVLFSPVVSVNILFILAYPLSAGGGYLLARRFVEWRPAAFAAGLFYGFSPYMVAQGVGHLNLCFVPLPPLILLGLHELMIRQERSARKVGALLGLAVAVQFLISTEITATTALFAAIATVILLVVGRHGVRARLRHAVEGLVVALVVAVVLIAYPLYVAVAGPLHISGLIAGFQYYYSALVAPLVPTSLMQFGTAHMKRIADKIGGNLAENGTYLGAPLVVLVLAALVFVRRRVVWVAGAVAIIAFVLSLGITFHLGLSRWANLGSNIRLPADILFHIPKLNDAFPVRYALFVDLFVMIVLAVTLEALHRAPTRPGLRAGLPAAVAVVVLLPLVPAWPYPAEGRTGVPGYFTSGAVNALADGSVALVYPVPVNTNDAAQLWQAQAGYRFKEVGGYFVVPAPKGAPSGSQFYEPTFTANTLTELSAGRALARTPQLKARLTGELHSWGVSNVVVQPVGADPVGFFTWLIGRPPDSSTGGVSAWYGWPLPNRSR
ncbi:MAG TPA: hypothetical protein VFN68_02985 [Acidimicrobiales bacterium]|nr:hypothetical protein [Acidimicrobiales bacterium]